MENTNLDIESLRNPFESNTEWQMRRSFLEVHADKFPLDRLICLSNCYVNVEMYGCRYPEIVMKQLRELEKDIPEYVPRKKGSDQREDILVKSTSRMKGLQKMNFVKAGNQTGDNTGDLVNPNGVTSSPGFEEEETGAEEETGGERMLINQKFQELAGKMTQYREQKVKSGTMSSVEFFYMVVSKCQMVIDNTFEPTTLESGGAGFECELFIDCVSIAKGQGSRKKTAKEDACEKAVDVLCRSSSLCVVENKSGNLKLQYSDKCSVPASSDFFRSNAKSRMITKIEVSMEPIPSRTGNTRPSSTSQTGPKQMEICQPLGITQRSQTQCQQQKRKRDDDEKCGDLSQFILIYREEEPILSSLKRIADFNKVELNHKSEDTGSGWRYETYFGKSLIADGVGIDEKEARINSAERSLASLKEICWSLKEKQRADSDESVMTKDDLLADLQAGGEALPDSNIGNMLLRKMGWTGGGVGKEGNKGIAEPVNVRQVVNRQGLGLMSAQGTPEDFYNQMNKFVSDYIQSDNQSDIVFSPEFTKEERAVIHQVCQKFNLKATSRGTGEERYLTMGRKRNALQLLDYVMSKGGSTQKYEVIPPSGLTLPDVMDTCN